MTGISFIAKQGETSARISAYYFGTWTLYGLIEELNPNSFQDHVSIAGSRVFIPDLITDEIEHTIEASDSYFSLSKNYYFTERYFHLIQAENEDKVLEYSLGENLTIPPLVSLSTLKKAPRWRDQ
jgi:hypothetical protein